MSVYYECDMCGAKNLETSEVCEVTIRRRQSVDYEEDRVWCVFQKYICETCSEKIEEPYWERLRKRNEEYDLKAEAKRKAKAKQIAEEIIEKIEHEARWGKLNKIVKEEVIRENRKIVYLRPGIGREML